MQNPPKSQLFVRARALQYSRLRSAGHTKCNCALRAQITLKLTQTKKIIIILGPKILILIPKYREAAKEGYSRF